jgi:lipopolysaccharide assembly outer membrane protein LptD (OstA)
LKKIQIVFFFALFLVAVPKVLGQAPKKIIVEHSDFADVNQVEIPDAFLLTGNVRVNHDGVVLTCNKAYYFQKENYIKAFGNVQLVQGDTLFLNSKYAEYSGNVKKAFATGDAVMSSPEATLVTDTINFDRNTPMGCECSKPPRRSDWP